MKFKNFYLTEKFLKGMKIKLFPTDEGTYAEIYKNPSQGEIDDILKDSDYKIVRIGIDDKDDLYAWKGEVIHHSMTKELKKTFPYRFSYNKKNPTIIITAEKMGEGWSKSISFKAIKQIKRSFPKAKKIENLYGDLEEIKL